MESNGGSVGAGFELNDLYKQLKEVDSMNQRGDKHLQAITPRQVMLNIEEQTVDDPQLSQTFLKEQNEIFSSLKRMLGDFQSALRNTVNICSRSRIRSLHILDMPDEILLKIFSYVKGWEPSELYFSKFANGIPVKAESPANLSAIL